VSFYPAALIILGVSTLGSLSRVVIGPTIWDRLLGVGLGASKITLAVVVYGLMIGESYIYDLAMIFAVLGFLATVLLARFIEQKGEV
jgi:multicomponent Na+:H+ antiporter subunit F